MEHPSLIPYEVGTCMKNGGFRPDKFKFDRPVEEVARVGRSAFNAEIQGEREEICHVGRGIAIRILDFVLLRHLTVRLVEARYQKRFEEDRKWGSKKDKRSARAAHAVHDDDEEFQGAPAGKGITVQQPLHILYKALVRAFWPPAVHDLITCPVERTGFKNVEFNDARTEAAICK